MMFKTKQNGSARVRVTRTGFSRKRMNLLKVLLRKNSTERSKMTEIACSEWFIVGTGCLPEERMKRDSMRWGMIEINSLYI